MAALARILLFAGLFIIALGLAEAIRQARRGRFPGGVSDLREVVRLDRLNARLREELEVTVKSAENCFEIFQVLKATSFSDSWNPETGASMDRAWEKARMRVISAARAGFRDSDRLFNETIDHTVLMLRETFRYALQICMTCPLVRGDADSPDQCPILEFINTERRERRGFHENETHETGPFIRP